MNGTYADFEREAKRVLELQAAQIPHLAYAIVEESGYEFGLAAGGPLERLRQYFEDHLEPLIDASADVAKQIVAAVDDYTDLMRKEEWSGYYTQSAVVLASVAHAIHNVIHGAIPGPYDITMVAMAYLMFYSSKRGV